MYTRNQALLKEKFPAAVIRLRELRELVNAPIQGPIKPESPTGQGKIWGLGFIVLLEQFVTIVFFQAVPQTLGVKLFHFGGIGDFFQKGGDHFFGFFRLGVVFQHGV